MEEDGMEVEVTDVEVGGGPDEDDEDDADVLSVSSFILISPSLS